MDIKIIGLGGIGSVLSEKIGRFLNFSTRENNHIMLIDGDSYEVKNFERQEFFQLGSKAEVKRSELSLKFDRIQFSHYNKYVNESNIKELILEKDIIFVCVDNHKTRKLISDFCSKLNDIILISGGNELTDGNVQIYIRKEGKDLTPKITDYHPEIQDPKDKSPEDMSCEELSKSQPQLFFTNFTVAAIMCWVFFKIINGVIPTESDVYFDINTMAVSAKTRKVKAA